ncbi:MAG: S41 family peptidase [Roseburia sp.]|nr:S41 family peptidase [Roseburia sp.]MCM1279000.1 S41 family peptidase [Robinsoniella sp.]
MISLFSLLAIVFSLFGSYCNPYWNSISFKSNEDWNSKPYDYILTYEQAKGDLDYAMKYLKKIHPKLYGAIPEEIQNRYDAAVLNLQNAEEITTNTVAQEVQGIFSMLGDAHTHIELNYPDQRYMKYISSHNDAGDVLKGINGQTWEQLLEAYSDRISYEVKDYGMESISQYVNSIENLAYLGISVENGIVYNYETENGEKIEQYVEESDFLSYDEYIKFSQAEAGGTEENATEESSFVYYEINQENSAAVLTLYSCNYNSEYKSTVKNMFKEIKEKGIKNVAVDLRNNGGGNSLVANEFFRYIDIDSYKEWACDWRLGYFMLHFPQTTVQNDRYEDLLFQGNLYVLTSGYTFSSAMNFAEYVKDNHFGTIIGEPSGNAPDSYGDISYFKLPNSGIVIRPSTKKWYRIDNKEGLIEPDIACDEWEAVDWFYRECQEKF